MASPPVEDPLLSSKSTNSENESRPENPDCPLAVDAVCLYFHIYKNQYTERERARERERERELHMHIAIYIYTHL